MTTLKNGAWYLVTCGISILMLMAGPVVQAQENSAEAVSRVDQEKRTDSQLKDYKTKISELSQRANTIAGEMRNDVNKEIGDMQQKYDAASKEMEQLRKSTNETWDEVNRTLQLSLEELKKSLERTRDKIDQSEKKR